MGQTLKYAPAMLSDMEAEALRVRLVCVLPRLERRHMLEIADMLYEAARERRRPAEPRRFDAVI
jgi:hypothetical protein